MVSLRRVGVALGVLVLAVVGAVALGVLGAPSVTGVDNAFGGVNETATVIESDLRVSNPTPVGVSLGGLTVDYAVTMNGIPMANGTKTGVSVGRGNTTIPFRTVMANERIPAWWVSHVRTGERTTLRVNADVHSSLLGASFGAPKVEREIETDLVGAFDSTETRPLNASAPLVADPVLYVNETSGEWGTVTADRTAVETDLRLYNPKSYPIGITEIGYEIRMNGIRMGEGSTSREVVIPPGSTRTVGATTVLRTQRLDEWWVSHLENDQVTTLTVDFYVVVDLTNGSGGSVRIPLDTLTQEVETDIFDEKGAETEDDGTATPTATGGASGRTPTRTPTATPTPTDDGPFDDGTSTATDTPTPTPTPAGTATPTPTATDTDDPLPIDPGASVVGARQYRVTAG